MLCSLLTLLEDSRQAWQNWQTRTGCLQCGQCCEEFGWHLVASSRDLERWRELGRDDLLSRTSQSGWIWVDPDTKARLDRCPFIDRSDPAQVRCAIHEVKPDICRDYPTLAHSKRCLRGAFLGWWPALCCGVLPEWVALAAELPLAA